jgi:hypothetical protein
LAECFSTWSPSVTCPSAAMTTSPLRRTQITVVERELERARRLFLAQSGRLVDGMLLDIYEIESPPRSKKEPAQTLTMLLYSYHIGGVDYECSQDITGMSGIVDASQVRAGFPCSARYQPGNPQNSIVVAEEWSGLRMGLPAQHVYDNPDPIDLSHLRPGRG